MVSKKIKPKAPLTPPDEVDDNSSISAVEEDQYIVSHILAEKSKGGKPLYLVKWEDYPEEESTWEPVESFVDPDGILEQWSQTQERIKKGLDERFDLAAWRRRKESYQQAQRRQKQAPAKEPVTRSKEKIAKPNHKKESQRKLTPTLLENKRKGSSLDEDGPQPTKRQKPFEEPIFVDNDDDNASKDSVIDESRSSSEKEAPTYCLPSNPTVQASHANTSQKSPEPHTDGSTHEANSVVHSPSTLPPEAKEDEILRENFGSTQTSRNVVEAVSQGEVTPNDHRSPGFTGGLQENANISRQISREQSTLTSQMPTVITKTPSGSNKDIMANRDTHSVPPKPRTEEGKSHGISPNHRVEMRGRNEAEPNVNRIAPTEPATRKIISEPKTRPSPPPQAPKAPRALLEGPLMGLDGLIPLTCPYFHHKIGCEWIPCPFWHRPSDNVASYELYKQYVMHQTKREIWLKFKDPPDMCPYWYRNGKKRGCNRSIEDCWYAHWFVEGGEARLPTAQTPCPQLMKGTCRYGASCVYAHPDAQEMTSSPLGREHGVENLHSNYAQPERNELNHGGDSSRRTSLAAKNLTCPYWYQGQCKKSEKECKHAHELLEGGISWLSSRNETCNFWREGRCKWKDDECLFAHKIFDQPEPQHTQDEQTSIDLDSSRPSRPFGSAPRRSDYWRPTASVHPNRQRSFDSSATSNAPIYTDNGTLQLSFPDGNDDLLCTIIDPPDELSDVVASAASRGFHVLGLVPAWLLKEMQKSNPNFLHAELRTANPNASEFLSKFLKSNRNLCLVDLTDAFLFIYFENQPPVDSGQPTAYRVAAMIQRQDNGHSPHGSQMTLFTQEVEKALGITSDQFFAWNVGGSRPSTLKKSVCLMFDDDYAIERKLWTIYFAGVGATVFSYDVKGSWDLFCRGEVGAIIAHPEFAMYNFIPDFGKQLMGRRNVFQVGYDYRLEGPNTSFAATPLFPCGTTVLITDGIYVHHPGAALRILEDINKHNADKPPNAWTWRLAGRRGIKRWLRDLAVKHESELQAGDATRFDLYNALLVLFPDQFIDEDDPQHPGKNAPLITMDEILMGDYTELCKTEPQRALDCIVDWFAFTALTMRHVCRRFVVVHDGAVPVRWREKNQQVLFYTPEKYSQMFNVGDAKTNK